MFGGVIAYKRSFTRAPPLPAVAAGGDGERSNSKKRNSDRRRSSSSSASTSSKPKRRILPSEMSRLPQLSRTGQRAEWRTLLEDEVRREGFLLFLLFSFDLCSAHLFPSLSIETQPAKQTQHPLRKGDIPPEIRAIMNRLREAGEFIFQFDIF